MDEPLLGGGGGGRARAGTWSGGGPAPPPGLSRSPEASSTGRRSEDSLALSLDCITEDEITFSGGGPARDLRGGARGKSPPTAGNGTSPWLYARPRADSMRFDNISLDPWLQKFHQREAAAAGGEKQLLGTFFGVFLPCCQNIMGIILFIRLSWIVGEAGVMRTLGIVGLCCCATFLTTLSLAAIATNGEFKGGGPYFLISRNLGPEVGVGVGLCFYLATTTASSMYILGAVETVLDSAPGLRVFTPAEARAPTLHDYQLYGSALLLLASLLVLAGMKRLSKIAPLFFVPVVVSILLIFVGIGLARPSGEGITGLRAGTWADNWAFTPHYLPTDENGFPSADGKVAWSFGALAGLFFPSVTGIMAGSNRSASLKDPQGSIPRGTISAHLLTTAIYVTAVLLYGGVATRDLLLHERLLSAKVAWPVSQVVSAGIALSTFGASLQSLAGAPQLLQAIANDRIVPLSHHLASEGSGTSRRCTAVTIAISLGGILVGNLDAIVPWITLFFLLCYSAVNCSCALLSFMNIPSWRPRWRYHHWALSAVGCALCVYLMLIISWNFTLITLLAVAVLGYAVMGWATDKDWGSGLRSLKFRHAINVLLSLGQGRVHLKNWYPAPLILATPWTTTTDLEKIDEPCPPGLIRLCKYLQPRKGYGAALTMLATVLYPRDFNDRAHFQEAEEAWKELREHADENRFHGFVEVVMAEGLVEGFQQLLQLAGLGSLRPNVVVVEYPELWDAGEANAVVELVRSCDTKGVALALLKGVDNFPRRGQLESQPIDIYWLERDGGLMALLSQTLKQHKVWTRCQVRIFVVTQSESNATNVATMENYVKDVLDAVRLPAEVVVINLGAHTASQPFALPDRFRLRLQRITFQPADSPKENGEIDRSIDPRFFARSVSVNRHIREHSMASSLVFMSLPSSKLADVNPELYMLNLDILMDAVGRGIWVKGYSRLDIISREQ